MTTDPARRALVLSGSGRHADPWHPFAQTSARLAEVVERSGYSVEVRDDIDVALATLDDELDLIVVNAGDPWRGASGDDVDRVLVDAGASAFARVVDRGIAVLAMHAAASGLRDVPAYEHLLGGRWVPGVSWHPPLAAARVSVVGSHPIAIGLPDFDVCDELYAGLRVDAASEPIVEHRIGDASHPLSWVTRRGRSRLFFDALGHDERSYDSAGHRRLLDHALAWLGGDARRIVAR